MAEEEYFYYKQEFNNSCGAASLLMTAYALKIRELPIINVANDRFEINIEQENRREVIYARGNRGGIPLNLDDECERFIYYITSGASLSYVIDPENKYSSMNHTFTYQQLNEYTGDISLPHNLAFAARLIGLDVSINIKMGMTSFVINHFLHPDVKAKCVASNIPVNNVLRNPVLRHNQRRIRIVVIRESNELHYIVENPVDQNDPYNMRFMDPGEWIEYVRDINGEKIYCTNEFPSQIFRDSGISIILENSEFTLDAALNQHREVLEYKRRQRRRPLLA